MSERLQIQLLRKERVLRTWVLDGPVAMLGSDPSCELHIKGTTGLEPRHAEFLLEDGELTVVPEEGAQIYVNGEEVDFAVLSKTDTIKAGRLVFVAQICSERAAVDANDAPAPAPAPPTESPQPQAVGWVTKRVPELQILRPDGKRMKLPLKVGTFAIGSKKANLKLNFPGVESRHAIMRVTKKQVSFEVVGQSTMMLDGRPVRRAVLGFGHEIALGSVVLKLAAPVKKVRTPAPAPQRGRQPKPIPIQRVEQDAVQSVTPIVTPIVDNVLPNHGPDSTEEVTQTPIPRPQTLEPKRSQQVVEQPSTTDEPTVGFVPSSVSSPGLAMMAEELEADEWDEEDEEHFVEPFDLAEVLIEQRAQPATEGRGCSAVVVVANEGRVRETATVKSGSADEVHGVGFAVSSSSVSVTVPGGAVAQIHTASGTSPATSNPFVLKRGEAATITLCSCTWRVDAVAPRRLPRAISLVAIPAFAGLALVALIGHVGVAYALGAILPSTEQLELEDPEEVFVTVEMERPEEPKPKPRDTLTMAEKAPAVTQEVVAEAAERDVSTNVQSLLQTLTQGATQETAGDLKSAISNINAVSTSGPGSSFDIKGAIGRLEGDGVVVARNAGGGAVKTTGGAKNAGVGQLTGAKTGAVRGKVTKLSSSAKVQGSLSREQVSRVVNSKFHKIQGCYERELVNTPGLAGRITFEWTVLQSGSVRDVKVKASTLPSPKVADCISGEIKTWVFPKPDGGDVVIAYPFLFRSAQ